MRRYAVHPMFLTLQGEGLNAGCRAVFCRLKGCNGWSGQDADRGQGPFACSAWCDTDFVSPDGENGGRYDAVALARKVAELWGGSGHRPRFVVLTGGEPMLQADPWLLDVLHRWQCQVAIETNGTIPVPACADWITVSPKAGSELAQKSGNELKLVYPQLGAEPERYADLEFRYFYLQPKWVDDPAEREANTKAAVDYCLSRPQWRLGVQMHKMAGIK